MSIENVNLPDIGEGVTEGEMVSWLVAVGDTVEVDQPVAEVMTDKATVEVPSPIAGTVKEFLVKDKEDYKYYKINDEEVAIFILIKEEKQKKK